MIARQVVPVHASEQDGAFATLVLAFAADPVERWLYPEAHKYLTHFPTFLSAFDGKATTGIWRLVIAVVRGTRVRLRVIVDSCGRPGR